MTGFKRILAAAVLCTAAGQANAASFINTNSGWYNDVGDHDPLNTNFIAGAIGVCVPDCLTRQFNNFFLFDLATLAGQTIVSATLTIFAGNGGFEGTTPSETYGLFDYSGSIDSLLAGSGGLAAFDDLGGGSSYGQTIVSGNKGEFMPEVTLGLSAAAIADINAILASSDQRFAIGGMLLSLNLTPGAPFIDALFSGSGSILGGEARLALETGSTSVVPLPAALPLLATGLTGMGLLAWRRRSAGAARS